MVAMEPILVPHRRVGPRSVADLGFGQCFLNLTLSQKESNLDASIVESWSVGAK